MADDDTKVVRFDDIREAAKRENESADLAACFIVIAGGQVGRMYTLSSPRLIVGRGVDAGIHIDDTNVSRNHCEITRGDDGAVSVRDLGSTNGTFVNGEQANDQKLTDGDKIRVGTTTILKFSYQDALEQDFQQRQYDMMTRDALTGTYNRAYLKDQLRSEWAFALRHRSPLSIAMLDLDHFKLVNDKYGHPAGDFVLKHFAALVARTIRTDDTFARYGGEEFSLLMRETDASQAFIAVERIRQRVADKKFCFGALEISVSVSIGVATWRDGAVESTHQQLLAAADQALYRAKSNGRNRTDCRLD